MSSEFSNAQFKAAFQQMVERRHPVGKITMPQSVAREVGIDVDALDYVYQDGVLFKRENILSAVDPLSGPLFSALDLVREEMRKLLERNDKAQYLMDTDYGVEMKLVDGRLVFTFKESAEP